MNAHFNQLDGAWRLQESSTGTLRSTWRKSEGSWRCSGAVTVRARSTGTVRPWRMLGAVTVCGIVCLRLIGASRFSRQPAAGLSHGRRCEGGNRRSSRRMSPPSRPRIPASRLPSFILHKRYPRPACEARLARMDPVFAALLHPEHHVTVRHVVCNKPPPPWRTMCV